MKKSYKIGIVKYTDHASLNRIELGAKNCLKEFLVNYQNLFMIMVNFIKVFYMRQEIMNH